MRSFLKHWLPVLIWLGVIFVGSTDALSAEQTSRFLVPFLHWLKPDISPEALAQIHFFVRKLGHITEYAILAILLWRAVRGGTRFKTAFIAVWFGCAVVGASDEFHQSFVASRTAAVGDVLIDICGALVGLVICSWISGTNRKRRTNQETRKRVS
ncbi:MAG: VanZ family protein [Verrucomicrobiota bacterium]